MGESIQKLLLRNRPPRVRITYDVETGDAIQRKELPFVIGVIADLYGHQTENQNYKERKFIALDRDNFSEVMQSINPVLNLVIAAVKEESEEDNTDGKSDKKAKKQEAAEKKEMTLSFASIDDFHPDNIVNNMPEFKGLLEDRNAIVDLATKADANPKLNELLAKIISENSVIAKLVSESKDVTKAAAEMDKIIAEAELVLPVETTEDMDAETKNAIAAEQEADMIKYRKMLGAFANHFVAVEAELNNSYPYLMDMVAKIDKSISLQLDGVLHHADFQKLEASWRGLHYLVMNSETGENLKIKLFPTTRLELQNDLEKAIEFDQSVMFKKIYEEEFGTLGGEPYSCLIVDEYFGRKPVDVSLMNKLTEVAAAAHAPFLSAVNADMFDLKSFSHLHTPRDLRKIFDNSELVAWNSFRGKEDSRYANFFLPRVLTRLPYGEKTIPIESFNYNEQVDGLDNAKFCWGNPAYAMGLRISKAFSQYGWTAAIRGIEGGGLVEDLPAYTFKTPHGDIALKCPTETMITDRREKELSDLGFISLCHHKGTDKAVFFSAQSAQKPKKYDLDSATANAAISARLTYMLNVSRFAHYMKMLMRDKVGSFASQDDIQIYLNNWIAEYVFLSDIGSQDTKAKYPLREAHIEVMADAANPGEYKAILFLKPHFQLEELEVSLRLVASLPKLK